MFAPFRRLLRRRTWLPPVESIDLRRRVASFAIYLAVVLGLHVVAMTALEGLSLGDALWLTFTTVTTVGYGDLSAETPAGRTATVVLIYFGGIFVLFEAAASYFEYRSDRRMRMLRGRWRWNVEGHILLVNAPAENPRQYLERLVEEFRASRRFRPLPVVVLTRQFADGLPESLRERRVVHYHGEAEDPRCLEAVSAARAAYVVVLARHEGDRISDSHSFDILHRLREIGTDGRILAEAVEDGNRDRLRRAGADIVVRPMRSYPEMIVRGLVAPGAEYILEDLFTSRRDECWRYDVDVRGTRWSDLVRALVENDVGVPIAYRDANDGAIRCNPPPATAVVADKLYVIVREGNDRPDREVEALIGRAAAARA